jgi:hypothetical protein
MCVRGYEGHAQSIINDSRSTVNDSRFQTPSDKLPCWSTLPETTLSLVENQRSALVGRRLKKSESQKFSGQLFSMFPRMKYS